MKKSKDSTKSSTNTSKKRPSKQTSRLSRTRKKPAPSGIKDVFIEMEVDGKKVRRKLKQVYEGPVDKAPPVEELLEKMAEDELPELLGSLLSALLGDKCVFCAVSVTMELMPMASLEIGESITIGIKQHKQGKESYVKQFKITRLNNITPNQYIDGLKARATAGAKSSSGSRKTSDAPCPTHLPITH